MSTDKQVRLSGPTLVRSRAITEADTNTTVAAIDVPAYTFIPQYGVGFKVATAFDGGTECIDIGDGTATNGWLTTTNITETTEGMYGSIDGAYAITGKYYATADTIDAVVATGLTAGCGYVVALMYDLSDEPLAEA